jgi:DNA invertase Pin-like site-specific DNA recombinase
LEELAENYLQKQRQNWPELVRAGVLPEPTAAVVKEMVGDFKARHRGGKPDTSFAFNTALKGVKFGGAYARYSSDNSNPKSIIDQLSMILAKAKEEGRFIPWAYVYADYSVTGMDSSRRGYSSFKAVLADKQQHVDTAFIDDFTRASRDELEWWKLAKCCKKHKKRMIGASDGFDLSSSLGDMMVSLLGLMSRQFVKGLQQKVHRGMKGAADRKGILGLQPYGFTRREKVDAAGKPVLDQDGMPVHERCIDPSRADILRLAAKLFLEDGWSRTKIAEHFCANKVDDWDRWSDTHIRKMLSCPSMIGVFIWNRFRVEYDADEEKYIKIKKPRSEWVVTYQPELALVSMDVYRALRKKTAAIRRASPITGRKRTRNERFPTTLFSGTLFCEHCGLEKGEIKLIRSAGKYQQMSCLRGSQHQAGCPLKSSKSVSQIEERLLAFIRECLLSDEAVSLIVKRANEYLAEEAKKPQTDVAKLAQQVDSLKRKRDRLVLQLEDMDDETGAQAVRLRIADLQKQIKFASAEIDRQGGREKRRPKPLTVAGARKLIEKLRDLLNDQGKAAAAAAIREITGPIMISPKPYESGKRGQRWIAKFGPNLLRAMQLVTDEPLPTQADGAPVIELDLDRVTAFDKLLPDLLELKKGGKRKQQELAAAKSLSRGYVSEIMRVANLAGLEGAEPTTGKAKQAAERNREIASLLKARKSMRSIVKELNCSESTVRRVKRWMELADQFVNQGDGGLEQAS